MRLKSKKIEEEKENEKIRKKDLRENLIPSPTCMRCEQVNKLGREKTLIKKNKRKSISSELYERRNFYSREGAMMKKLFRCQGKNYLKNCKRRFKGVGVSSRGLVPGLQQLKVGYSTFSCFY